ncbi:hypothetical protein L2E82_39380 [Cichorium intybus]|uniref:Uncharacterized protein n=1 Tax=Cichorium intybus TaxID=13427 RepID=A0ACB9AJ10_CICIN|nr:hypothetical protein L2E82_39380 [Cichorium intybus]
MTGLRLSLRSIKDGVSGTWMEGVNDEPEEGEFFLNNNKNNEFADSGRNVQHPNENVAPISNLRSDDENPGTCVDDLCSPIKGDENSGRGVVVLYSPMNDSTCRMFPSFGCRNFGVGN